MGEFDLHPDRLGTTDELGRRVFPQPADVKGPWRRRRSLTQALLLVIFLALPWFRIDGRQALLLDLSHRHFEIFGLTLRAHNAPLLVLVLAAFCFGLFFVTSIWGRIWCGWACPQTVFIDAIYRRVERKIEGSAHDRRRLDRSRWTMEKITKRTLKWFAFIGISSVVAHSFMAYFIGTEQLAEMMTKSPNENLAAFTFMAAVTLFLSFNFGWFREQFCVIVCPYGRFQSVLMDSSSMIVAYNPERGEPRATPQAKAHAKTHGGQLGDCVNCYRCVQVCPVGIDIRRGLQMECIACTACMDACDDIMTKMNRPPQLIQYSSLNALKKKPNRRLNWRSALYGTLSTGSIAALILLLSLLKPVDVSFFRAKDGLYQIDESGLVTNHFKLEVSNATLDVHELSFSTDAAGVSFVSALNPLPVEKDNVERASLFVRFPKSALVNGEAHLRVRVTDRDRATGKTSEMTKEVTLVGPLG